MALETPLYSLVASGDSLMNEELPFLCLLPDIEQGHQWLIHEGHPIPALIKVISVIHEGWMNNEWIDGWTNKWMNGWMGG